MSDKELNLIGYINVDGSNNNITGSINENGSSNNLVGSTINTSLEFVVLKGASAYEVAKNNGYKGTVEEWLNDLRYDHSEEFLEFANGIQNQINALAERHERYEEKFDGLNEKIDGKVIPTKVSEFENDKGYLTEHQNLDEYVKFEDVYSKDETYSKSEVEEIANNSGKVKTINGVEPDDNGNVELKIEEIEIPEQVQADWNEEDESQLSFIKNTQEPKAKLSALDEFFDLEKTRAIMIDMGFIEGGEEDEI